MIKHLWDSSQLSKILHHAAPPRPSSGGYPFHGPIPARRRVHAGPAQAVPPAQRSPEVAAFIETMQLDEEARALLPLSRVCGSADAAAAIVSLDDELVLSPVLPAAEVSAQRVLLAALKLLRMTYVCGDHRLFSRKIRNHLLVYVSRGCGAAYPSLERCIADLGALLRRDGGRANAVCSYLWIYAAVYASPTASRSVKAAALQQLGDALAADLDSLDRQLGELQGVASTTSSSALLITSRQLRWTCYLAAYQCAEKAKRGTTGNDAALALRMLAHCSSKMMQLEPLNLSSLLAEATEVARNIPSGLAPGLQLLIQGYEEAKQQHQQLRALKISCLAVTTIMTLLLASGALPAPSSSMARTAVEAFEEAEASCRPIKRLLPETWVSAAAACATVARQTLPEVLRFIAEPDA